MPVPCGFSGGTLIKNFQNKTKSGRKESLLSDVDHEISNRAETLHKASERQEEDQDFQRGSQVVGVLVILCASAPWNVWICILKSFHVNISEQSVRNRETIPITASPSKLAAASKVGGTLASPIN